MALTTINHNLAKQKSMHAIRNAGGDAVLAIKAFWMGRAQEGKEGNLYFYQTGDLTADEVVVDAACKVHFVYVKKGATATDAFYNIFNDATDDSTAADAILSLPLTGSGDEQTWFSSDGLDLSAGLVHGSYTAFLGYNAVTASTSGDGPANVFLLIGDA